MIITAAVLLTALLTYLTVALASARKEKVDSSVLIETLRAQMASDSERVLKAREEELDRRAKALFENLSLDPMFEFDIELAKPCKEMELFGAEGTLSEDGMRIHITSDVAPYGAIGVALTY